MLGEKPISTGLLSKKGGSEGNRLAVPNKAGAGGSSRLTAAGPAVGGRGRGRRSADWVRALLAGGPPAANAGTDVRGRGSHGDAPPPHRAGGAHHGSHRDTAYSREQEDGWVGVGRSQAVPGLLRVRHRKAYRPRVFCLSFRAATRHPRVLCPRS